MAEIKKHNLSLPEDLFDYFDDMAKQMNIPRNSAFILALNFYRDTNIRLQETPDTAKAIEMMKEDVAGFKDMMEELKDYMGQVSSGKFKK